MICVIALRTLVIPALLNLLHNRHHDPTYERIPEDPEELYNFLEQQGTDLKDWQREILFPSNGKSNSKDWDITSIGVIFRNFSDIPAPRNGWNHKIAEGDTSAAAGVEKAIELRNRLFHTVSLELDEFYRIFFRIREILTCLLVRDQHKLDKIFSSQLKVEYVSI